MHEIHFTLSEARDAIPWITQSLKKLRMLFMDLSSRGFDILKGRWSFSGNGHGDRPIPEEFNEFIEIITTLDRSGVLIKDFEKGLVDFPHIRPNGEEVYLCWMLGEPDIEYWHRIQDGFQGRVRLSEDEE